MSNDWIKQLVDASEQKNRREGELANTRRLAAERSIEWWEKLTTKIREDVYKFNEAANQAGSSAVLIIDFSAKNDRAIKVIGPSYNYFEGWPQSADLYCFEYLFNVMDEGGESRRFETVKVKLTSTDGNNLLYESEDLKTDNPSEVSKKLIKYLVTGQLS